MTSKRVLYGSETSPPVRAVRMTFAALGLDYDFKLVNTYAGETRTPEFLKKNPQHTVPTLEETDGKYLWDSHAIMAYLVRRYGKNDELYPKGFHERAIVDQRLHYESCMFTSLVKHTFGPFMRGEVGKEKVPALLEQIHEVYAMLETFLGDNEYIAGKSLTIADFSLIATITSFVLVAPIEQEKFPKLNAWVARMKKLPYFDQVNAEGLKLVKEKLEAKIAAST